MMKKTMVFFIFLSSCGIPEDDFIVSPPLETTPHGLYEFVVDLPPQANYTIPGGIELYYKFYTLANKDAYYKNDIAYLNNITYTNNIPSYLENRGFNRVRSQNDKKDLDQKPLIFLTESERRNGFSFSLDFSPYKDPIFERNGVFLTFKRGVYSDIESDFLSFNFNKINNGDKDLNLAQVRIEDGVCMGMVAIYYAIDLFTFSYSSAASLGVINLP